MSSENRHYFEEFLYLCDLFGSCIGRTQGAGGNISVKWDNKLLVKASGYRLSAVNENEGYVYCNIDRVKSCYDNQEENLESAILEKTQSKPSMESFFHLLPKQYIVHIHSTFFCKYLCKSNTANIFSEENFPRSLFIPYIKPGLKLAQSILPNYSDQSLIFLENHGIILLGNSIEQIVDLYDKTVRHAESIWKEPSTYSSLIVEKKLKDLTKQTVKPVYNLSFSLPSFFLPVTPDHFLFLQDSPLQVKESQLESSLLEWKDKKQTFPSVLQIDSQIYILGKSYIQCQNKEEYLRSYFEIYDHASFLPKENLDELMSCSKETFRIHKE